MDNKVGKAGIHIAEMIRNCGDDPPLQQLWLGNCSIPEEECTEILKSLSMCKHLTHLDSKWKQGWKGRNTYCRDD